MSNKSERGKAYKDVEIKKPTIIRPTTDKPSNIKRGGLKPLKPPPPRKGK